MQYIDCDEEGNFVRIERGSVFLSLDRITDKKEGENKESKMK